MSDCYEALVMTTDGDGRFHFLTRPHRTIIDIQSLPMGKWIEIDGVAKIVSITLDGETVAYKRVGKTLAGHWACVRTR